MIRTNSCLSFLAVVLCLAPQVSADPADLESRQNQLAEALKDVSPAVVSVTDGIGFGTGVVVSGDGIVLTASHVVESQYRHHRRSSRRLSVIFPDGHKAQCRLLGRNRYCDAAVLKIINKPRGDEFPHVERGRSRSVRRGDWCFALGHPGGRREDRPAVLRFGRVLSVSDQTIVSDNAIVLGDSGGPLFDMQGRVIGIHSMITRVITENRHVAIDVWNRDWDRLLEGDAWGTLRISDEELASSKFVGLGLSWKDYQAEVSRIVANSPASRAGFRMGDELLSVNGRTFADRLGLSSLLARLDSNEKFPVTIRRNGEEKTLTVITGQRPDPDDESEILTPEQEALDREFREQLSFTRRIGNNEKRTRPVMRDYARSARESEGSVVRFLSEGKLIGFGAVMSADGDVITKASEINRAEKPVCVLPDGSRRRFREIGSDLSWDLMLVRLESADLTPMRWSSSRPDTGQLLVTPDSRGRPLLPGVVSIPPMTLPTSSQGFLGVRLLREYRDSGAKVEALLEGGAAERDGIESGDVILSINGSKVRNVDDTIDRIKKFAPYQQIKLRVLRDRVIKSISVTLTPRFVSDRQDALLSHYTNPESSGVFASVHNSGFPEVLQHDTDLFPHQCGGPLMNIHGEAVGLNIARAARIISYAIPADVVLEVYEALREDGIASR